MAKDHRRLDAQLVQEEVLLDDPHFLREIVERVVQQLLEAEMTEHLENQGRYPQPARPPG
jgi:transposase-like protein